jgi:putative phosphoesterase
MDIKIIQISDLHFGEYKFSETLKKNLLTQISEENPDLIIVSGDLTAQGYVNEFISAKEFLDELNLVSETYAVPGNHDACNVGIRQFKRFIGERKFIKKFNSKGLVIIGLDSSEPDIHDGQIGIDQLEWFKEELKKIPDHKQKIVTFHHHILPIPLTGRERNILLDAGDILKVLIDNKVDLVLSGHKHVPHTWMLEDLVTINSGTATTTRLHGENKPSYNIIKLNEGRLEVNLVNTETGIKENLAYYSLQFKNKPLTIQSNQNSGYKSY